MWSTSSVSAAATAAAVDAKIKSMHGVVAQHRTTAWILDRTPPDLVVSTGYAMVRDRNTIHLDYLGLEYQRVQKRAGAGYLLKSDGKRWELFGLPDHHTKGPISTLKIDDSTSPADWITRLPRYMHAGFHGESPFTHLVAMASKPGSGYRVSIGEHVQRITGTNVLQRRLVIERTPAAAKALGPVWMEIVFNTNFQLPVRARIDGALKGKPPITIIWNEQWATKPMKLPDSQFKVSAAK